MQQKKGTSKVIIVLVIILLIIGLVLLRNLRQIRENKTEERIEQPDISGEIIKGELRLSLTHEGRTRTYLVYIPQSYNKGNPVLINLHGGAGNGEQQCRDSKISEVADKYGFIVVCPDGTSRGITKLYTWNDGYLPVYATENNIDDVGFIDKIITQMVLDYGANAKKIYVAGYSNGAMLAYRLACELPTKITAIAPVEGSMGGHLSNCNPSKPVPVIIFHGLKDLHIPFEGGMTDASVVDYNHPSVQQAVDFWVRNNGLSSDPTLNTSIGNAKSYTYGEESQAQVKLWVLEDGGHTWPSGDSRLGEERLGKINLDISASEEMWKFFQKYSL